MDHSKEVRAFLTAYYGTDQDPKLAAPLHTVTTKDRFGLVLVKGQPYAIVDIGLRMLTPRELYTAQGFPASYIIERGADGRALTKTAQVRLCGNSVCPPIARALVAANYADAAQQRRATRCVRRLDPATGRWCTQRVPGEWEADQAAIPITTTDRP